MNRIYRVVWSACRGALVVASELARTHGSEPSRVGGLVAPASCPGIFVMGALAAALSAHSVFAAEVEVASGNTRVFDAPNGVQVIDIATANGAGLSHNRYIKYNVDPRGQILNNNSALTQAGPLQSQLAGQIVPNVNLTREAQVILNEVVAANRSSLQGYVEVLGGKADVIVANPYGITCAGCGFINTDRATLTTGVPVLGADGSLAGFEVNRGDILVSGAGLDGRNQNVLDLVARSIKLDGQINGQDVKLIAGSNRYDYASRTATATVADDDTPLFAIDSTALGGMYANRIQLLATEAGVGVRMRGEAAASADDFTLSAAGEIEIHNRLSAKRDLAVTYTGPGATSGAITISGNDAGLSADRDITLQANSGGGITLSEGVLTAGRHLAATAGSLTDSSGDAARFAGQNTTVTVSGAVVINGSTWGAGNNFTAQVGALAVGGDGARIYSGGDEQAAERALTITATTGDLALADAELQAPGRMALTAKSGNLTTGDRSKVVATGDMTLAAAGTVANAGQLLGESNLTIEAADAAAILNNSGWIQAAGNLNLGRDGHLLAIDNRAGAALVAERISVRAEAVRNAGTVQARRATDLVAASLRNEADAEFFATTWAGGDASVRISGLLDNHGVLQSAGDLAMIAGGAMTNSGRLLALRDDQGGDNGSLTLVAAMLANSGVIDGSAVALVLDGRIDNSGDIQSRDTLALTAGDRIHNAGGIHAGSALAIDTGAQLTNTAAGQLKAGSTLQIGSVSTSFVLDNAGLAQSGGAMTLGSAGHTATLTNQRGAVMLAGDTLAVTGGDFDNQGRVAASNGSTLIVRALTNGGIGNSDALLFAAMNGGASVIQASGALSNHGAIHANDAFTITAGGIYNSATGGLSSLTTLALLASGATHIDNSGALYAGNALALTANGGGIYNRSFATVDSSGTLTTHSRDFVNNGAVVTTGDIAINATQSFVNETVVDGRTIGKEMGDATELGGSHEVQIANEGIFDAGMNAWIIDQEFVRYEQLTGITEAELTVLQKAQIIANGAGSSVTIDYGDNGLNRVAVISAPTVNIGGTGTFTNEDLALHRLELTRRWLKITDEASGDDTFGAWARVDPTREGYDGDPDDDDYNWGNWNPGDGWERVGYTVGGSSHPDWLVDEALAMAMEGATLRGATVTKRFGTGIFASSFNFTSGTLVNAGSPWPDDGTKVVAGGQTSGSLNTGTNPGVLDNHISGPAGVASLAPVSPLGIDLRLPTNPNGYFVIAKNSSAKYLVETNPNFAVGSDFVGSSYLADRYGFNPDTVQKRLGDANYEAYLIRQQLIQQVGSNVLNGYDNEANQMQRLMDQAYNQGQALGLEFGKALTPEQAAGLTEDIVWMEEVEVNGERVLAPRVYLAPTTVAGIVEGAVISANDTRIAGDGLQNTGGTIEGGNSLTVKTSGDITNTSGTLRGGDVSITSTEGSIRNETLAVGAGDDTNYSTAIGKTAGIESTGDMELDAAKDITALGADVKAGGDASLAAGGDVTFDTIVDKTTRSSSSETDLGLYHSITTNTTTTENNIGSQLSTGGNLAIKSGGDTTIAGSSADVGGDLDADTGGSFNVVARQDKVTTKTETKSSGLGVGGGLAGSEKTTVDDFEGKNVGSTLNIGGNAKIQAGEQMVLQGSDASIDGNADIAATGGIQVLDGLDEKRTTTRTETTTFFKIDSSAGAGAGASAEAGVTGASATAQANAGASSDLKLMETTTTVTKSGSNTSVASNLNVGGDLSMKSDGTVTVQGSNVEAGGDLGVDAKNVEVLTGRNEAWSNTDTSRSSIGVYNEASAGARARAGADVYGAGANASAEAATTTTIGARHETENASSYTLTNTSSSLKSGGDMSVTAQETATFQGAEVGSGGDMTIDAENIRNIAAQDVSVSSSSSTQNTAGIYLGTNASAEAGASSNENGMAAAGAEASAGASAGLRYSNKQASNTEGSVTQVTNTFTSGGDFKRTAQDTIVDQGTQVEAGGNIEQSARVIRDEAVSNETYTSRDSQSHDARIGVSAEAEASASTTGSAKASAGVGAKASYDGSIKSGSEHSTTAVTSRFKAGGDVSSSSQDETVLVGAQFEAGGDMTVDAGSLDVRAARDTTSSSSTSHKVNAELKVSTDKASAEADYGLQSASDESSTARTGSLSTGGNLTIRTRGDASFEGTELSAGGDAEVAAGGNVDFEAARDTTSRSKTSASVEAGVGSSKSESGGSTKSGELGAGAETTNSASSTARTGSIKAGGGVKVSAGDDVTLEGTDIEAGRTAELSAGGDVNLEAATSTSTKSGLKAGVSMKGDSAKDSQSSGGASAGGYVGGGSSSKATTIQAGGGTVIKE